MKRKLDLWGSFVGRADIFMKDGLHLSGKGAAVFADGLTAAVDSSMGCITNVFGSKLKQDKRSLVQTNQ